MVSFLKLANKLAHIRFSNFDKNAFLKRLRMCFTFSCNLTHLDHEKIKRQNKLLSQIPDYDDWALDAQ